MKHLGVYGPQNPSFVGRWGRRGRELSARTAPHEAGYREDLTQADARLRGPGPARAKKRGPHPGRRAQQDTIRWNERSTPSPALLRVTTRTPFTLLAAEVTEI
jgi:hypothetical protein